MKLKFFLLVASLSLLVASPQFAFSADKNWNGEGSSADWFDNGNWLPSGKPGVQDDAKVDVRDASVEIGQTFGVKSLTIGGKKNSTLNVSNFVSGSLEPDNESDDALVNRKDGKLVLKGSSGKITMKGAYKDSEEVIPDEPGFMLYVK